MVTTKNLMKKFYDNKNDEFYALNDVSINVEKGKIFGILGPNGAGKTTLLRILSTVLKPSSGNAEINGYCIDKNPNEIKKSIGFLSGNTKLYGRLTPKELLYYFGKLYDMKINIIEDRYEEVVELLDIKKIVNQPIEKLSTGQTQRVSIARCIFHKPGIYILDEPTLGLDILSSKTILEFIKQQASEGKTVIFSTHYMQEAEFLCDKIALIHKGRILDIKTFNEYKISTDKNNLTDIFFSYMREDNKTK